MTVVAKIKAAIEKKIVSGELAPGTKINENKLISVFQVSRTPIREALLALEVEGFIEIRPRTGIYVKELDQNELLNIFEVLAHAEGLCAYLVTQQIQGKGVAELLKIQKRGHKALLAQDNAAYDAYNQAFHQFIYQQCRNSYLVAQIQNMRKRTEPYRTRHLNHTARMHLSWVEHQAIVEAIKKKEPDKAKMAAMMHIAIGGQMFEQLGASYPEWFVFSTEDTSSWFEYCPSLHKDWIFPQPNLQ